MGATLKDVAERAGVSTATISRVLSSHPGISQETRQKVLVAVEELHYRPNALARGLARSSSNIIGAVIMEFSNPFYASVLAAVETVSAEKEHVTVVAETQRQLATEIEIVKRLRDLRVAGVVIAPMNESIHHLLALRQEGVPVVAVGVVCQELDYVSADDRVGGRLVGRHFIANGHRRIGFVSSGEPYNETLLRRLQGLTEALSEAGIAFPSECYVKAGGTSEEHGEAAADVVLEMSDRPTAVFAATDRLAVGFMDRLQEKGVCVPDDIAVAGYDNITLARYYCIPLTTVSYPTYEMGLLAAQMLFDRIDRKGVKRIEHLLLQPELVVRESCGATRKQGPGWKQPRLRQ